MKKRETERGRDGGVAGVYEMELAGAGKRRGELTKRKSPKESWKFSTPPSASSVSTIWNPPGVRMMANESQKPPYEDRAVAPNVLPTAISLRTQ